MNWSLPKDAWLIRSSFMMNWPRLKLGSYEGRGGLFLRSLVVILVLNQVRLDKYRLFKSH